MLQLKTFGLAVERGVCVCVCEKSEDSNAVHRIALNSN